jgi:hypothetical protein
MTASRTKEPEAAKKQFSQNELLGLFMWSVFAATLAELRELDPTGGRFLVLRRRIIALFALRTLQGNYFTHKYILTDSATSAP